MRVAATLAVAPLEVVGIVLYLVVTAWVLRLAVRWAREAIEPSTASLPVTPATPSGLGSKAQRPTAGGTHGSAGDRTGPAGR